jgi:hypothetical protein
MASTPATVKSYLASLPPDRRAAIQQVRDVILDRLPKGYEEGIAAGALVYSVPLSVLPDTYNGHALWYAALASQKNYMVVYLMSVYGDKDGERKFRARFKEDGKKLDMGKSCVRFKRVEDLSLGAIGDVIARHSVDDWVKVYQSSRAKVKGQPAKAAGGTRAGAATTRSRPGKRR